MGASRDPYRELFERSADAILIIEGGQFVDCNDAAVSMLRCRSREEVLRTHPSQLSPPTQPDGRDSFTKANEMIALAFEMGSHRFEWDHQRADGDVFPVEVLLTAVESEGKPILHVVWRDISVRLVLEEQLRLSQKMEAVGKLAGGIAHDFNNLLVVILGHADFLSDYVRDQPVGLELVGGIQDAGERAAALVKQLLAFGRKQQRLPEVIDLNCLLGEIRQLLERLIGEDLEIDTRLCEEPLPVLVDPGQIEQVIMNLASNARDASPLGGVLRITTWRVHRSPEDEGDGLGLPAGEYAGLSVSDSGVGMNSQTVLRAFDPFFTTKEPGRGTGLGLSTVYSIVEQSHGAVRIDSTPGLGCTVEVYLPTSEELPVTRSLSPPSPPQSLRGSEHVLVVEDDERVRQLITRVLTRRGYRVTPASDGAEGEQIFIEHADEIDLVVTDVVMPKLGGAEMVRRLAEEGHHPPVLYLSGYADSVLTDLQEMGHDVDFMEKPFSPVELAARVRRAIGRRTAGEGV